MRKLFLVILLTLSLIGSIIPSFVFPVPIHAAITLQDSFTETGGSRNNFQAYGTDKKAEQSFNASANYSITSIEVMAKRAGTVGDAIVDLYLASGDNPTGDILATATTSATGWNTDYEYHAFTFSVYYPVTTDIKYCIVLRLPTGDGSNFITWVGDDTGYSRGQGYYMTNGVTWLNAAQDFNFKVYGAPSGSPEAPISITNVTELQAMSNNLTAYYELANDIDASATSGWNGGSGFEPVGDGTNKFEGNFDGNGYAITDLYINRSGTNYVGLFGCLGNNTLVTNFTIFNGDITGGISTGGIAGGLYYTNSTVSLVGFYGDVTGSEQVGGLVGVNNGNITQCFSLGTVTATIGYAGGLVGYSDNANIENCFSHSQVTGPGSGTGAGFLGQNQGGYPPGVVLNCYSKGAPSGFSTIGGLVATQSGASTTSSYWDTETSGQNTSAGGTGKTTIQMQTQSTFTGWNFTTIWNINTESYPVLRNIGLTSLDKPANFNGYPSSVSISLLWNSASHAERYLVRYSITNYPSSITSGTFVSLSSSLFTSQAALTPGTTYFFSLWSELGGYYSTEFATFAITTSAYTSTPGEYTTPETPPGWLQSTDYTKMANLEPFYTGINNFIDATGAPKTQGWLFLWLVLVSIVTLIVMFYKGFLAGLITLMILMLILIFNQQIPGWMLFFVIIAGVGTWSLAHGRGDT